MPPKFRKTYACFYDGQQEELYFKHFSKLIKDNFEGCSVDFKTISNFNALVKSSTGLPKFAVFDYDKNEEQFMKRAKEKNIEKLYTNLNFDLWLLLHKKKYNKIVTNNDDYIEEIKKAYNLETKPDIKKDIKKKKIIGQILDKIDLNDVKQAIKNAKKNYGK